MKTIIYCLLSLSILASCSSARKIRYKDVNAELPKSNANISIATWDQRTQILDGSRQPEFVGYLRSGAGIAYPMKTKSGKPFVNDMSSSIANSLKESGKTVQIVSTKPNDSQSMIVNRLKAGNSSTLVLLKCNEYHTDGYGAQTLRYDINVIVLDKSGIVIKERNFVGKKPLGGNAFWGAGKYKTYIPAAFKTVIEEIFNDEELNRSLVAKS